MLSLILTRIGFKITKKLTHTDTCCPPLSDTDTCADSVVFFSFCQNIDSYWLTSRWLELIFFLHIVGNFTRNPAVSILLRLRPVFPELWPKRCGDSYWHAPTLYWHVLYSKMTRLQAQNSGRTRRRLIRVTRAGFLSEICWLIFKKNNDSNADSIFLPLVSPDTLYNSIKHLLILITCRLRLGTCEKLDGLTGGD